MEVFGGSTKVGESITTRIERRLIDRMVPLVPKWISSYHLTLMTIPIDATIILASFLARENIHWLWLVSFAIALQWLTDSLDGAVGRYRKEGLIRWGYYMDHFLDFTFLCSILIGYMLILPEQFYAWQFFILAIFGAFMVNSFLAFGATNEFRIAHLGFGPTEMRMVFIIINTLFVIFGKTHLAFFLPYVLGFSVFGLCFVVYKTQKEIWEIDMKNKTL